MKFISRARRQRRANALATVTNRWFEMLEPRQLLAGVTTGPEPFKHLIAPPANQKVELAPPRTFKANGGQTRTINAGTSRGGPEVTINVGPVVNISRVAGNQSEADIAINPTNPDQVFAVSNHSSAGLFSSRSNDGGANWTTAVIATGSSPDGLPAACCDARVEYDGFGNLYMIYLNTSASTQYIARSTNNGGTWALVDTKTGSWDNPDLAVGANNQIWVQARKTSAGGVAGYGGQATGLGTPITFSAFQLVPTTGSTGSFGDVAVCNDGSILISYVTPTSGEGPSFVPIWRDPDGLGPQGFLGAGGGTTTPILNTPTNVGGFDYFPAQDSRSVDPECSFAVVPPGMPFAGRVYFMYANETVNENNDHDIVIRYSDDNGLTWSNEIRVNDDPGLPAIRTQFLGQIAVDPTTGAVVVSWHDARNDNGVLPNGTNAVANDDAQFYGALSTDGGLTWTNFQIDPGWSNDDRAANGIDYGDWTGSDFYGGRFFAVWASNAQGVNGLPNNPDVNRFDLATARVDIIGAGLPGIYGLTFDDSNGNGVRDGGEPGLSNVTVYIDGNGNSQLDPGETNVLSANGSFSITGIPAGTYTIRAVTPAGQRPTFPVGGSYTVVYNGTNAATGQDFGFVNPRIAGTVFNDANDNGVFDVAESGLTGVTVFIDSNNNGNLDGGEPNVVTPASGAYTLGGLADGTYVVRAVTPAGRRMTFPAAGSYTRTISNATLVFSADHFGFTDRVRIGGVVYNDANGNGNRDVGETGLNGIRVYQDLNNNSVFDNTGGTFNSTNVPLPVPPSGTVGITTSNLAVSGVGNVTSLTVKIGNLTHTYDGDLLITLISPQGTRVILSNRRGGSSDNFINTVFDDAAATAIGSGSGPFTGTFRPDGVLATLNGQNANGTWQLEINDQASGDSGTLSAWSITLGSTEPNQLSTATGDYGFNGLGAGTYNIRQVPIAGQTLTEPASGVYSLTLAGGALVTDADFGNASVIPPGVTGSNFRFDGAASTLPNPPHAMSFSFSQNVGASIDPSDLQLFNSTGSFTVPTGNIASSYNGLTNTATFTFPGYPSGILPDGDYTATLLAAGVTNTNGNPLPANFVTSFFVLSGDANHDRIVNVNDFTILAGNFGQTGKIFSQGDFNYDGTVNVNDFTILAGQFGVALGPGGSLSRAPFSQLPVTAAGESRTARRLVAELNDLLG